MTEVLHSGELVTSAKCFLVSSQPLSLFGVTGEFIHVD